MAKAEEKKVLGLLPRSTASVLLAGLLVTIILAFIWSWVMDKTITMSEAGPDKPWLYILELLALGAAVGLVVGILAGAVKPINLWIAAGLAVVGMVVTAALLAGAAAPWDGALLGSMAKEAFGLSVSVAQVVIGIVAAAFVGFGTKIKL